MLGFNNLHSKLVFSRKSTQPNCSYFSINSPSALFWWSDTR